MHWNNAHSISSVKVGGKNAGENLHFHEFIIWWLKHDSETDLKKDIANDIPNYLTIEMQSDL